MNAPTRAQLEFVSSPDPETTFCDQLERMVRRSRPRVAARRDWAQQPFRPLLLGYNGKGNVGADLRVREIVRQLQVVFGHVGFDPFLARMGNTALDPVLAALSPAPISEYFPDFMDTWLRRADGVIACEGTVFTSRFSDMLGATFAGGLALAARRGLPAVAYGVESGKMSPRLDGFARRMAMEGGLVLARSQQTHAQLTSLGMSSRLGADTAWTYDPPPEASSAAHLALRAAGWGGRAPVGVVCPMNPFCWPLHIDFDRARRLDEGDLRDGARYDGVLFHTISPEGEARFDAYLKGLRRAIEEMRRRGWFPVLVGMEKIDEPACARLNGLLGNALPSFVSGALPASEIVSVLHSAAMVVTSRFHAAVLSLNACVPTIGIAIDERIRNLFTEAGMSDWFVECDADELGDALLQRMRAPPDSGHADRCRSLLLAQMERIGAMGLRLHDEIVRIYGDFPVAPLDRHWRAFLPPLSERLRSLL